MKNGVILALLASFLFGIWNVTNQLASKHINQVLGAILISVSATIVGSIVLFCLHLYYKESIQIEAKGVLWAMATGVLAFFIDFSTMKGYNSGVSISTLAPILVGGSVFFSSIIGFAMGDSFSPVKILSLSLIFIGVITLAIVSSGG